LLSCNSDMHVVGIGGECSGTALVDYAL
jgi:hypothetical protein